MEHELVQIKTDMGELKTNVGYIKEEMYDMKQSLSTSVDKISNSMTILAGVTEKINHHIEEHKYIHEKINLIKTNQEEQEDLISDVQKKILLFEEHKKIAEEKKKNSVIARVKDRISEYIIMIIIALAIFVLFKNLGDFIHFMNNQNVIQSPTQISPK